MIDHKEFWVQVNHGHFFRAVSAIAAQIDPKHIATVQDMRRASEEARIQDEERRRKIEAERCECCGHSPLEDY